MPAKSEAQRRLFGAALGAKRGKGCKSLGTGAARHVCETMNTEQLRDFAKKKKGRGR